MYMPNARRRSTALYWDSPVLLEQNDIPLGDFWAALVAFLPEDSGSPTSVVSLAQELIMAEVD